MSSSIAIPRRRRKLLERDQEQSTTSSSMSPSSFAPSSFASSSGSPPASAESSHSDMASPLTPTPTSQHRRRSSLLSPSLARCEHTVVNVGSPDAPRLITCVKASQGFDWNQEIFLPSYVDHEFEELERKQEPVQDIILTDEEAAALLPR